MRSRAKRFSVSNDDRADAVVGDPGEQRSAAGTRLDRIDRRLILRRGGERCRETANNLNSGKEAANNLNSGKDVKTPRAYHGKDSEARQRKAIEEYAWASGAALGVTLVAADSPSSFLDDGPTSNLI
jgi:hypothetical protein